MTRIQEIDTQIAELKEKLNNVVGTETEVYTRIVGYYRAVKNWNAGKKDEYKKRVLFNPNSKPNQVMRPKIYTSSRNEPHTYDGKVVESVADCREIPSVDNEMQDNVDKSQLYFYRKTCPNCPAAKKWLEDNRLDYQAVDVDTEEGFKLAGEYQIYSTPTIILDGVKYTDVKLLPELALT